MKKRFFFNILSLFFLSFVFVSRVYADSNPLYLALLMDASGSMGRTDKEEIRKLAAQAIVTLLSPEDKVAVVEFDSDARELSGWLSATDTKAIIQTINKVGKTGEFTDFRVGLETASKLFLNAPAEAIKVILLLSDGILEPNPYNDKYAPYYIQYAISTMGKGKSQKLQIYENEYREKLSLIASRIINTEILPSLKKNGVEIYTVGFSPEVDKAFLSHLANETSKIGIEPHYFYADKAIDLMDTFVDLLHYWQNMIKLYTKNGQIVPEYREGIFIDEFLDDVFFIGLTEKECDLSVQMQGGIEEVPLEGTHSKLKVIHISKRSNPGKLEYSFKNGMGEYRIMVLGRSAIAMDVIGLNKKYQYSVPISAIVRAKIKEKDARPFFGLGYKVIADVAKNNVEEHSVLQETNDGFSFNYLPKRSGIYRISFTLFAKDSNERDILPRVSRKYEIEVMPDFFVEPKEINFGNLKKGEVKSVFVKINSGLTEKRNINVKGKIKPSNISHEIPDKLPCLTDFDFSIDPGQILDKAITMSIPNKSKWGDFEGTISFQVESGESCNVEFRVHVPSWIEKFTTPILALFAVIIISLIALVIIWSKKTKPVGVFRPIEVPTGILLNDIDLSKVKKGVLKSWLNWKKNIIIIGGGKSNIILDGVPKDMQVSLIFYRFSRDYIRNISPKNTEHFITISDPSVGIDINRGSGESYELSNGSKIQIEGYKFIYINI